MTRTATSSPQSLSNRRSGRTQADEKTVDAAGGDLADTDIDENPSSTERGSSSLLKSEHRRVSVSLRTLAVGTALIAFVFALVIMTCMYLNERSTVVDSQQKAADYQRAEQVALDYAVNAATMDFQHMPAWRDRLIRGTSPGLQQKLKQAAGSMDQLLVPLEWNSTAKPLTAKVRSEKDGVYLVDTFVSVLTKTTQAPDNLQSTATYSLTIDGNTNWQITDVGGIGNLVRTK